MSRMSSVNRLGKENYECYQCEEFFSDDDVRNTWRCPRCQTNVHIYAEDVETGTKIVLVRKQANEVEAGDLIHLPGQLTGKSYFVLGINNNGNKLVIGLKGYGQYVVDPFDPINCRIGSW